MDRDHEDLVLVTGNLGNGRAFNSVVDWLTPTKVRRTRVLGEAGMLVADTLSADLYFYANAHVTTAGWPEVQARRGVAEGDMTRFALERREPLAVELEEFCALLTGADGAAVVSLEEGLETVAVAEAVLESAASGETVALTETT
jgi:predicted dehydrogenase